MDCGGVCVEHTGILLSPFRPFLYMFVRSESTFAYRRMFEALVTYAKRFFDLDTQLSCAVIDHSGAIASTLEIVWPQISILTCWEHLLRKARQNKKKLTDKDFYKDTVCPHLRMLHSSRSHEQFLVVSKKIVESWQASGETAYADWVKAAYLSERWTRWHVNSSIFRESCLHSSLLRVTIV